MKNSIAKLKFALLKVKKDTGGCVLQTEFGPLCIASDISREACQAMSDNRYGGQRNVWWFNGVPCDMESVSRVDYNNGGILMNDEKNHTGGCVSEGVTAAGEHYQLCIASDVTKAECQAMAEVRSSNVWWFNNAPCDMNLPFTRDVYSGGLLMERDRI